MENPWINQGIEAAAQGNLQSAKEFFFDAVQADPRNEEAWLLLGHVLDNPEQRHKCYQRVLQLNPTNEFARISLNPSSQPPKMSFPPAEEISFVKDDPPKRAKSNQKRKWKRPWLRWVVIGFSSITVLVIVGVIVGFFYLRGLLLTPPDYIVQDAIPTAAAGSAYAKAIELMENKKYQQALYLWTDIINADQDDDYAYYQRAICNYALRPLTGYEGDYISGLEAVTTDLAKAVILAPEKTEYLLFRREVIADWAYQQDWRVNQRLMFEFAAQDGLKALEIDLPREQHLTLKRKTAENFIDAGQCQEGLDLLDEVLSQSTPEEVDYDTAFMVQSKGYACQEQLELAIQSIDESLYRNASLHQKEFMKSTYLYEVGRVEEAFELVSQSIERMPSGSGWRYYLRSVIYADAGNLDAAKQELRNGEGSTWQRNGYYFYAQARIALLEENYFDAIQWLQYAEASLPTSSETLRQRIVTELAELNAEPLEIDPDIDIPGLSY